MDLKLVMPTQNGGEERNYFCPQCHAFRLLHTDNVGLALGLPRTRGIDALLEFARIRSDRNTSKDTDDFSRPA
jgi:hypothetical protein